jgi:hypothetical protein
MNTNYTSLVVVIPTRNRADLAVCNSLCTHHANSDVDVLVSDNSTSVKESCDLKFLRKA